jgi:hypothetical protein
MYEKLNGIEAHSLKTDSASMAKQAKWKRSVPSEEILPQELDAVYVVLCPLISRWGGNQTS